MCSGASGGGTRDVVFLGAGAPSRRGSSRGARTRGALDPYLLHVAGSAVDLEACVHELEGGSLRDQLRHRHLAQRLLAGDEAAQRVVGDAARDVGVGGEIDELVANRLVADEGAVE